MNTNLTELREQINMRKVDHQRSIKLATKRRVKEHKERKDAKTTGSSGAAEASGGTQPSSAKRASG